MSKSIGKFSHLSDSALLQADLQRLHQWSKTWRLKLNPSKCKSFRMSLKTKPIETTYFIENFGLEHVDFIRDLGVVLDTKLTFANHIEIAAKKSNRALGLLIRSFQLACPRGNFNRKAVLASYCANVRSVLEYGCVVWGGAAAAHTDRLERTQHKFLMWLNAHSHNHSPSLSYNDLLRNFNITSLRARRVQYDLMFLRNVFKGRIDSAYLLSTFHLFIPARVLRQRNLCNIPHARVRTVKEGLFVRIPTAMNVF